MEKPSLFHVKKRTLLAVAGWVWMLAGFNVARFGFSVPYLFRFPFFVKEFIK